MSKNIEKSAADLERIAQEKISEISRVVLDHAGQVRRVVLDHAGQVRSSANGAGERSREIETVVLESLRVRKALKRVRRTQAKRLRRAERAR
jgi:hypothetical protein